MNAISSQLASALGSAFLGVLGDGARFELLDSSGLLLLRVPLASPAGTVSSSGQVRITATVRAMPVASGVAAIGQVTDSSGRWHRRWPCVQSDANVPDAVALNCTTIVVGRYVELHDLVIG